VHPSTSETLNRLLDTTDSSVVLSLGNPRSMAEWRRLGIGPPYIRIGRRCVRYRYGDLLDYIARHRVESGEG
jgi:hypothetical protein